jgi:epsilon-lactone hydrolase
MDQKSTDVTWNLVRIEAIAEDLPKVEALVSQAKAAPDAPVTDAIELRSGNSLRLGGPLIRRPVEEAMWEVVPLGSVRAEKITVVDPPGEPQFLYFHGGAYVRGSTLQARGIASTLALKTGGQVLAVAYRQAPEHVFPAAIDDGIEAYKALLDNGASPQTIILAGDSCGGALVISIMLRLRELGWPLPACGLSISPWSNLTLSGETWRTNRDCDLVGPLFSGSLARMYLGKQSPTHPLASPAFANLAGLPPLLIIVGEKETMFSDSMALNDAARRAGVRARLEIYQDMIHVFPMFDLRTGDIALQSAADFALMHTESRKTKRNTNIQF